MKKKCKFNNKAESTIIHQPGTTGAFSLCSIILTFVLLIMSPLGLAADAQKITQYTRDTWKIQQGLPQITVQTVTQTRQGYIWLGTQEGLVRFDGVKFKTFNKNNVEQLLNNWVQILYEDLKGTLWIGTAGGGLTGMKNGKFTTYTTQQGLANNTINALHEDREGNLWIGTQAGLNRLRDGKITAISEEQGLTNDKIQCIIEDQEGNLWIGTETGGLKHLGKDRKTFTHYTTGEGLAHNNVKCLCEDGDGSLWIGTDGGGLIHLKNKSFTTYTTQQGLSNNRVWSIHKDKKGNLWIGTFGGGLNRLRNEIFTTYSTADGLPDNFVMSIFADQEGSLWIGTGAGGLHRLGEGKFTTYSSQEGLSDNVVSSVYEDSKGNLWIGTYCGGLNRLDNGKFTAYTQKDGLSHNLVRCIHEDGKGNLWIGTDNGLNHRKDNIFTVYTKQHGLLHQRVWCIHEDRQGNLWVGTENGLNVREDEKFVTFPVKHELLNDRIITIYEDRAGNLWIGTNCCGLVCLKNGKITTYTSKEGLSSDMVWSIYEDKQGSLWIGTRGGGLNRWKDGTFTRFTSKDGLFDDIVYQILEDDRENFWMSCNKGIFRVSKSQLNDFAEGKISTLNCVSYDESDGMKSRECNGGTQPPGCKTRDGKLWFPTINGIVSIDPNHLKINQKQPPVVIEKMIAESLNIQEPLLTNRDRIVLSAGTRRLEIQYTCLSFLAPRKVRFKYKLEGFDEDWLEVGNRRTAFYTKLPPGDYAFRVIACNNDGIWNTSGEAVSFSLNPFFYQTFWFYLLCALVFLVVGFTGYRVQVRRFKKREQKLYHLVEERTKELKELNVELENKVKNRTSELLETNKKLIEAKEIAEAANRAKSMFLTNMSHEIRTPMNAILGFAEILAKEAADERQKQLLQGISSSGRKLLGLISDILDFSRIEAGEMTLHYEAVSPHAILNEIKHIFYNLAREKDVDLQVELDPDLPGYLLFDSLRIRQILFNLVDNAVKFTHTGFIRLAVRMGETEPDTPGKIELIFSVQDSGIGIPENQLQYIFDTFSQVERQRKGEYGGTGLGLAITRLLTKAMGGTISVRSTEGVGTSFRLSFRDIAIADRPDGVNEPEATPGEISTRSQPDINSINFEGATVLVVDDQELSRQLLAEYLDYPGIRILEAEDGEEAVEVAKLHHPDLVLMDMEMPVMNGYEAMERLKKDETLRSMPIIAITGYEEPEQELKVKKAGGDGYLEKPISQEDLVMMALRFLPHSFSREKPPQAEKSPADSLSPQIKARLPGLIAVLLSDFTFRWEKISRTFFLDEIQAFARDIRELADQYSLSLLRNWGDRLSKEIQDFNMQKVARTLDYFPELIDEIQALLEGNDKKEGG